LNTSIKDPPLMKLVYASVAALAAAATLGAAGYSLAQAPAAPVAASAPATAADLKPGVYKADPNHTKVAWAILHNGFSTFSGLFAGVEADLTVDADPTKSSLSVTVPIDRVITGSAGLDNHLKTVDFFDVAKFPAATFKSTSIVVTGPNTGKVTGDLTMHGVTRPVTLDVKFVKGAANRSGQRLGFDATGVIKRSEFGIKYGLPASGDDVEIRIGSEFRAQAPAA
jgi:polyisoprenoid-binding protein YceI